MSGTYRKGDKVSALYQRDWYAAEIIRLEPDGRFLVRRIKPAWGRAEHWTWTRPESWWVEEDDLRLM